MHDYLYEHQQALDDEQVDSNSDANKWGKGNKWNTQHSIHSGV
jgi:hypothetical protein